MRTASGLRSIDVCCLLYVACGTGILFGCGLFKPYLVVLLLLSLCEVGHGDCHLIFVSSFLSSLFSYSVLSQQSPIPYIFCCCSSPSVSIFLTYLLMPVCSQHKPSTTERLFVIFFVSLLVCPISFVSFSVPRCHVFRGLPLRLFSGWFHAMA